MIEVQIQPAAPVIITPELQFRTLRTALAGLVEHGMRPDLVEAAKHALEISRGRND